MRKTGDHTNYNGSYYKHTCVTTLIYVHSYLYIKLYDHPHDVATTCQKFH